MDPLTTSTAASSFAGAFTGMMFLLVAVAYSVPVLLLGLVFYYFTGDKKKGHGIIGSLANVGMRFYNYSWMFVSSILALIGTYQSLNWLMKEIFDVESTSYYSVESDSEPFVRGILYLILALILFAVHFVLNRIVQSDAQKKGSVLSKFFVGVGVVLYSVIVFFALIGLIDGILGEIYDNYGADENLVESLAVFVPSLGLWIAYAAGAWNSINKERK